jgi:hypothetical protein
MAGPEGQDHRSTGREKRPVVGFARLFRGMLREIYGKNALISLVIRIFSSFGWMPGTFLLSAVSN